MSYDPRNRFPHDKKDEEEFEVYEASGIMFIPTAFSGDSAHAEFSLQGDSEEQVLKTPFGIFKISMKASEELSELGDQLAEMFTKGLTVESLENLSSLVSSVPPLQDMLSDMPELKHFLDHAMQALMQGVGGQPPNMQPMRQVQQNSFDQHCRSVSLN